jgi:hypothetical protein
LIISPLAEVVLPFRKIFSSTGFITATSNWLINGKSNPRRDSNAYQSCTFIAQLSPQVVPCYTPFSRTAWSRLKLFEQSNMCSVLIVACVVKNLLADG